LLINNGEITGELPPSYGNRPLLIVRNYSFTGTKPTFFRPFLHCRDFLLRRMISHFHTTQAAEMAAKLFFGATKGMDRENRKNFINTGTIHLFSISGLHVTLVAGIFLLLLRPVPFAWRYRITALLTLFYVLCSGAPLPAIRAGAMVMIWCILRSMLFKSSSWNSIMITWSIFALIAPSTTGSLSAQYSFGITAALILLLERSGEYTDNYRKILAMMPPGAPLTLKFRKRFHRLKNLTMYLLVPLTAFAAGCGMSLYRQNLFVPGSIFANLILTFFTPGLFIAMFFKMIAGTFSVFFDQCGAFLLESIFFLFSDIAAETAGLFTPVSVGKPPLWSVLIYYLFFFGTLGLKSHRNRIFMLCGTIVILFSWQFFSPSGHRFIAVSYGCNSPAMLVLLSPGGESTVVNAPDPDSAAAAGMLMKEYGTLYASLYFSNRSASTNYGIGRLNDCLLRVTAYEPDSSRKATKAFLRNINHSEAAFFREPGNLRIIRQHKDIFICRTAQGFEITSRISDSGRTIQIQTPDGKIFRETLPWCSLPVVWQCDLK
ncbi:MAG: ComEC/Rec2 family competence protein, partial [Lentisphaeria bacterium]|nr:ComEC/Rec2 family competence protein [Lentisphaeria bacterium]